MFRWLRNIYMVNHLEKLYIYFLLLFLHLFCQEGVKELIFFFYFFSHENKSTLLILFTFDTASYSIFAAIADLLLLLYSSDEICDGIKNCPGGEDEDPRKCPGIP